MSGRVIKPHEGKSSCTSIVSQGRKKLHTTWDDGSEMIEEFDLHSHALMVRKHRWRSALGSAGTWVFEVGAASAPSKAFNPSTDLILESTNNPVVDRTDSPSHFVWRIRNLRWPKDVYSVTADRAAACIVVRTSNKKYYKRLACSDVEELEPRCLAWDFANGTLVIRYAKSDAVVRAEAARLEQLRGLRADKEGDVDCKQQ